MRARINEPVLVNKKLLSVLWYQLDAEKKFQTKLMSGSQDNLKISSKCCNDSNKTLEFSTGNDLTLQSNI